MNNWARWCNYRNYSYLFVGDKLVNGGRPLKGFKRQFFPDGKVYIWIQEGRLWNYLTQYKGLSDR